MTASCSIGDETVKVWSSESSAESTEQREQRHMPRMMTMPSREGDGQRQSTEQREQRHMPRMMTMPSREGDGQRQSHSGNAESRQGSPTGNGIPYKDIVERARLYIHTIGGFEKFAEPMEQREQSQTACRLSYAESRQRKTRKGQWGLIRPKDV